MNWKTIEQITDSPDKKWYFIQKEIAAILGISRQHAAAFLKEYSIPYYAYGTAKKYFLPDVLDAWESTRWKTG